MNQITVDIVQGKIEKDWSSMQRYEKEISSRLTEKVRITRIGYIPTKHPIYDRYRYIGKVKKTLESDIMHITNPHFAYLLNFMRWPRLIVTCHDAIRFQDAGGHKIYWMLNGRGMKKADAIITLSNYNKNLIAQYLEYPLENIHVVHTGVDKAIFKPIKNAEEIRNKFQISNERVVLSVASDQKRKNIETILKTISLLEKKYDILLIKVGENKNESELVSLLGKYDIQSYRFLKNISNEELALLYNCSDVCVFPSLAEGGIALPILEAMACGCPVVTSNIEPSKELLQSYDIPMIDPMDYKEYARVVEHIFEDDTYRKALVKEGFKVMETYTWDHSARKMEEIYKNVCAEEIHAR